MKVAPTRSAARQKRHSRLRLALAGTTERPRLAVFRSLNQIYAQVIDDVARVTVVSASDVEAAVKAQSNGKKKADVASLEGNLVAERAKEKGISQVVFDRGG